MAVSARAPAQPLAPGSAAQAVLDPFLRAYAQILFSRSRAVGAIVVAATALWPKALFFGAGAVLLATSLAYAMNLSRDAICDGLFGYNALLIGVAGAALLPLAPVTVGLVALTAAASVPATAATRALLGTSFGLPVLTVPFLLTVWLLVGAAATAGVPTSPLAATAGSVDLAIPDAVRAYLQALGAIFFLPRVDVGLLVLAALVSFSRIAVVLTVVAFAPVHLLGAATLAGYSDYQVLLGLNAVLTAIAIGGIWFVPGVASVIVAAGAALVAGLVTLGLAPLAARLGLPLLVLPFNATVLLLLAAMRQRQVDAAPKSVDFVPGTPEANLNYLRTRVARFGRHYAVRFHAPFMGRWICSQSVDGAETHRGIWREALDFQVAGPDDRTFGGRGDRLTDYLCYRLPVLAVADGTVARVVDGVPDNPVGEMNLRDNWGNAVILQHGPALYSLVAHLSPDTIKVREGDRVRQGDVLGLCGSSGRSPTPHLHVQLQATARLGVPPLHAELHDVIEVGADGDRLHGTWVPARGDRVRNIEPDDDIAARLQLTYDRPIRFELDRDGRRRAEVVRPDIDLAGNQLLRSSTGAVSFYESNHGLFQIFDTVGPHRSVLHLVHIALGRVPYELGEGLTWHSHLPARRMMPAPLRLAFDLVSPFVPVAGPIMEYRATRDGATVTVHGRSRATWHGTPAVESFATLDADGIASVLVTTRDRTASARRVPDEPATDVAGNDRGSAREPHQPGGTP
jgi:urea transporter